LHSANILISFFKEEVIVGRVEGATVPEWHVSGKAVIPTRNWDFFKQNAGKPFPEDLMKKGQSLEI